jgi:hypothetical protein
MSQRVVRRPNLPLTEADEADLAHIRRSPASRAALRRYLGNVNPASATEAAFLHALLQAGMDAVQRDAADAGYAELALQQQHDARQRRQDARRRRPSWADEE